MSADAQETPFSYPRLARLRGPPGWKDTAPAGTRDLTPSRLPLQPLQLHSPSQLPPPKGLRGLGQRSWPLPFASAHEKRRLRWRTAAEAQQHHPALPKQGEHGGCSGDLGGETRD